MKRAGRALAWLLALPVLWFVAGLVGAALPAGPSVPPHREDGIEIRLVSSAIHYDILLPATPETRAALAFAAEAGVPIDDPGVAWILAGWGARDFYTTTGTYRDVSPGAVASAVAGDQSVLRVDVFGAWDGAGSTRLIVAADGYARLLRAVAASRDGPALAHPGFTATDRFFEGAGRFHALNTCNVWVGEMLRAAGVRFGLWTPTPQAVRLSLALWGGGAVLDP